jgi:hypothetical protein
MATFSVSVTVEHDSDDEVEVEDRVSDALTAAGIEFVSESVLATEVEVV